MADEKHARYLVNPETGRTELVVADEVVAKQAAGWVDPQGVRGNGEPYNKPEDQLQTDAAGASLEAKRAWESKSASSPSSAAPATPAENKEGFIELTEAFIKSL